MEKEQNNKPVAWRVKGKGSPVIEVLESFNGDCILSLKRIPILVIFFVMPDLEACLIWLNGAGATSIIYVNPMVDI